MLWTLFVTLTIFRSAIVAEARECVNTSLRRHLEQQPPCRFVDITEDADRLLADVYCAPYVRIEDRSPCLLCEAFDLAHKRVAGIVEDDVDAAKMLDGLVESVSDFLGVCDVELQDEEFVLAVMGG